jgi:hypothetical protein
MKRFTKIAAAAAATVLLAGQAHAATWLLDYTSLDGAPVNADLTVTASDILNAVGGFDVTGVTGNVDGDTVTALIHNPTQPFPSLSADGLFIFDNVIWPTSTPPISNPGLFFAGSSGAEYNLFSAGQGYQLYKATPGVGYLANSSGTLSVSGGVPEPAAWTMMIVGFAGAGALLRRRRAAGATLAA